MDSQGGEGKVSNEQSQDRLLNLVTEIGTEKPAVDYMQDIWQLQLRDLREACLEYIRWPETKQAHLVWEVSESSNTA